MSTLRNLKKFSLSLFACLLLFANVRGQVGRPAGAQDQAKPAGVEPRTVKPAAPDLSRQPTLYVVAYAHLDTEWRWDYVTTQLPPLLPV